MWQNARENGKLTMICIGIKHGMCGPLEDIIMVKVVYVGYWPIPVGYCC